MNRLQINCRTLQSELDNIGVLPAEALYLGTALDNLPVLYNIKDKEVKHILFKSNSRFPFETIHRARSAYQERNLKVEFVMISNQDMLSEVAWQKIATLQVWIERKMFNKKAMVIFIEDLGRMLGQNASVLDYLKVLLIDSMQYPVRVITCSSVRIPYEWEQFFSVIKENENGLYEKDDYEFFTPV